MVAAYFPDGLFIKCGVSVGFGGGFWLLFFLSQWDSVTDATGLDGMKVEQSSFRYLFVSKHT